jgi:hypothetical protein
LTAFLLIMIIHREKFPNWIWLIVFVKLIIHMVSALCFVQLQLFSVFKSWPHLSLPSDLHRHAGPVLIFLEDYLRDCACVSGATRLAVCLFHQYNFCHIQRECCGSSVPSIADFILKMLHCDNSLYIRTDPVFKTVHSLKYLTMLKAQNLSDVLSLWFLFKPFTLSLYTC